MFDEVFSHPHSREEEGETKALKKHHAGYQGQNVTSDAVKLIEEGAKIGFGESIQTNFFFLAILSIIELLCSGFICQKKCFATNFYAGFLGFISLGGSLVVLVLQRKSKLLALPFETPISIFLALWWALGAGITTVIGPFLEVANGYFSVWGCLLISINLVGLTYGSSSLTRVLSPRQTSRKKYIFIIAIASVVLFFTFSAQCYNGANCLAENFWGIPSSVASLIICVILHIKNTGVDPSGGAKQLSGILAAMWSFLALSTIIDFENNNKPQQAAAVELGNSYFATWCCVFASLYLFYAELIDHGHSAAHEIKEVEEEVRRK